MLVLLPETGTIMGSCVNTPGVKESTQLAPGAMLRQLDASCVTSLQSAGKAAATLVAVSSVELLVIVTARVIPDSVGYAGNSIKGEPASVMLERSLSSTLIFKLLAALGW